MKRLIPLLVVAAALAVPSAALAGGVVLKVERASHQVAVATTAKHVALVHTAAAARLHVGERISFAARPLRNGTFAASSLRVVGRAHTVHFRGLLLAATKTRYVLSAGGAVLSLYRTSTRTTASANDSGPAPGSTVTATATVASDGELEDDGVATVSPTSPGGQIDGQLTLGSGTITVTSDNMSLVLKVPTGFDLSSFQNGQEVLAVFSQQADGSLLLTTLSGNQDEQQANSQQSSDQSGGDQGGTAGSSSSSGSSGNASSGSGDDNGGSGSSSGDSSGSSSGSGSGSGDDGGSSGGDG